jgi:hypothetical protein
MEGKQNMNRRPVRANLKGGTMRFRTITMCAVFGAASLLASTAVMAQSNLSCTAGNFLVETTGPVYPSGCDCTEITYDISGGKPDHVATVVASTSTDCSTQSIMNVYGDQITGNQWYAPAVGDPITGLGEWACHEEAAKVNPSDTVSSFTIRVSGVRGSTPKSVVTKKGGKVRSCEIAGLGEISTPGTPAGLTEVLCHGECCVEFTLDVFTGAVIDAALTDDSNPLCSFEVNDVDDLKLTLVDDQNNETDLGFTQFGEGFAQSGTATCITRWIGGRVITWGYPCPE